LEDQWKAHLTDVLLYHVASGNVSSGQLNDGDVIEMVNGETVTIDITDGTVTVNGAEVILADQYAENGVAHVIDAVLTPSFLDTSIVDLAAAATSTLADLVGAAELVDALAAADASFTVSTYIETSARIWSWNTHELTSMLSTQVFAPTNEAFAALDNETVAFLTSDEGKADLTDILTYHVIPSVIASSAIPEGETTIASLQGTELTIVKTGDSITVNGVAVTAADNLANNGIVHLIGEVLTIPEEEPEGSSAPSIASMAALASSLLLVLAF